ncbi:hypothetical protein QFZ94_000710 [Paraburkholderia sp. JPY465]
MCMELYRWPAGRPREWPCRTEFGQEQPVDVAAEIVDNW